jgi:hypothetical protein
LRTLIDVSRVLLAIGLVAVACVPANADAGAPTPDVTVVAVAGHEAPAISLSNADGSLAVGTITTSLDPLAYTNLTATGIRFEKTVGAQTASFAYLVGDDPASTVANMYGMNYLVRTAHGTLALDGGEARDGAFAGIGFSSSAPRFGYDLHLTKTAKKESAALSTSTKLGAIDSSFTLNGSRATGIDLPTPATDPLAAASPTSLTNDAVLATPAPVGALHVDGGIGFGYRFAPGRSLDLKVADALDASGTTQGATLSYTARSRYSGYAASVAAKDTVTPNGVIHTLSDDLRLQRRIVPGLSATLGFGTATTSTTDPTYTLAGVSANARAGLSYSGGGIRLATTLDKTEVRGIGGTVTPTSGVRYDVTLGPSKKVPFHVTASVVQRYGATNQPLNTIEVKLGPNR